MLVQKTPQQRLLFFDNLRYLMVLLVIVFHSGASYSSMVAFWPFHESTASNFLEVLTILLDTFLMTILFFIAGYFALPSVRRKGGKEFLKEKFKRLGVPWLVVMLTVLPILDYLHYSTLVTGSGSQPQGFGTHWLMSMERFADFYTGRMRMSEYLNMTEHFYQRYMWFLSLLLLFFVIFWLLYEIRNRLGSKPNQIEQENPSSNKSVYVSLAWVGVISILIFVVVKTITSSPTDPMDLVWFSLANVFQFQLAKLAFYVPGFVLGIYASSRNWFSKGQDFGRPGVWGLIVFVLMVVNMLVARTIIRSDDPSMILQAAFLALYPLWTLSFLGFFVSFASRRWNSPSTINRELASNSYNMYLAHYVFVLTLPLLLSNWIGGNVLVKFVLVSAASILLSYVSSRYLIKPYPRIVLIGLISLNVFLAVFS